MRPTAQAVSAILGEPVTSYETANGTGFKAPNGSGFFLFHTSKTTAEHIAMCLGHPLRSIRQLYDEALTEPVPNAIMELVERLK